MRTVPNYPNGRLIYLLAVVTRWQYTFTHKQYIQQHK